VRRLSARRPDTASTRRTERRRKAVRRRQWTLGIAVVGIAIAGSLALTRGGSHAKKSAAVVRKKPTVPTLHPPGPIPGYLLIADRGNNRMLLMDSAKHVYWSYPARSTGMPFRFDDDTFFGPKLDRIISNQEDQHTIQIVSFPGRRILWRYGHVNTKGSAPGYLNTPDDAYLLPNGLVTVADAYNCRVIFINQAHRIVRQYGTTGVCAHNPPSTLGAVNGATPLADGGTLISEINGSWIDDIGANGTLRWTVQAPVSYPSDPQLLAPNRILLADYARPGHAIIMDKAGHVIWKYGPSSGPGALDHPSLAMQIAPGLIAINDDYRQRVVIVSVKTHRIVWQYGHTDVAGRGPNYLHTPDGMDLLTTAQARSVPALRKLLRAPSRTAQKATKTAPAASAPVSVSSAGYKLPAPVQRAVAVGVGGAAIVAGGLDAGGASTSGVFRLNPVSGALARLGSFPEAFHDAAGAVIGGKLFVFGGGSAHSSSTIQAFDLGSRHGTVVGHLPHPLSDVSSATSGGTVYLIGGYDDHTPRAEIYATTDGAHLRLAGKLPHGVRYAAVAAIGGKLVIAGGTVGTSPSANVYEFDPATGRVSLLAQLPAAVGHAAAVVVGGAVYVLGGIDASGRTVSTVTRIDVGARTARPVSVAAPLADAAVAVLAKSALLIGGTRGGQPVTNVLAIRAR
jgi:outer membrane protein assembly factor BamB